MTAVQLSDKHLGVIRNALEAYVRANLGQFRLMLDELFPFNSVSYEDAADIEGLMKSRIFPELSANGYHGITSDKMPENAKIAAEIMQTIRQYLAVKRNDGYYDASYVSYDDPFKVSNEPLPVIPEFKQYKDFVIEDREVCKRLHEMRDRGAFIKMWKLIEEQDFYQQHRVSKWESMPQDDGGFIVRAYKPEKKKGTNL